MASNASASEQVINASSPDAPPARKKRCFSGCSICRARKVKCDGRPGGCANCERLLLKCPGNDPEHLPDANDLKLPNQAGGKRKKTYRSCVQCRNSKTRCSGERPVCSRCSRKGIECAYDSDPNPAWARIVTATPFLPSPSRDSWGQTVDNDMGNRTSRNEPSNVTSSERSQDSRLDRMRNHTASAANTLSWLYDKHLPNKEQLYLLLEQYFANVHPLRCFGFIHKPSFMQRLDEMIAANQFGKDALFYAVCALGAKFYALDYSATTRHLQPHEILNAGNSWARESQKLVLSDLDAISVQNLMAAVLLHDHDIRIGRFASAFQLAGICVRMAQALQMNVEYSTDILCSRSSAGPSPAAREARRRLMWCIWVCDAWVGSGVDQLTQLNDVDVKIQLPCSDRYFIQQIPVITETLEPGRVLKFLPNEEAGRNPESMGMAAYFTRLTAYRKKVLRYVKHLDTAQPPWLNTSGFSHLDYDLKIWLQRLPPTLSFTSNNQYIRNNSSQLGALCLLHCTFHQTMCDLYRIGMPRLFKIRNPVQFPPERLDFLSNVQETCFYHATQIASVLQVAAGYGVKTLADPWLAVIAHDSNRVILYYLTKVLDANGTGNQVVHTTLPLVRSNLDVLNMMTPIFSMSKSLHEASVNMVRQSGLASQIGVSPPNFDSRNGNNGLEAPTAPSTPVQSTPEYVLNPLAIYRLARKAVPENEKHTPELIGSPESRLSPSHTKSSPYAPHDTDSSAWMSGPQASQRSARLAPSVFSYNGVTYGNAPRMNDMELPLTTSNSSFDDLQMFFSSEYDTIWHPADTIVESTQWGGIAPWESESRPKIALSSNEVDMFMPSYPWPLQEA